MTEKKRNYLLYKIKGRLIKVDPDIYYEIVNVNPEQPKKKYNKIQSIRFMANTDYVRVAVPRGNRSEMLSRYIMKPKKGQIVDHRNRDKLDNRRENLRIVTPRQSSLNRKQFNKTGFMGVIIRCPRKRQYYMASYSVRRKVRVFYIPVSPRNLIIAAVARDMMILQNGDEEYALLNFPHLKDEPFKSKLSAMSLKELKEKGYEEIKKEFFEEKTL